MKRNSKTGCFQKHPVKVGDLVVPLQNTFGYTKHKTYKVLATSLSNAANRRVFGYEATLPANGCIVEDDDGYRRAVVIGVNSFGHMWEKLPKKE